MVGLEAQGPAWLKPKCIVSYLCRQSPPSWIISVDYCVYIETILINQYFLWNKPQISNPSSGGIESLRACAVRN